MGSLPSFPSALLSEKGPSVLFCLMRAERMWRWLEDAGPPYEGSPSVGVPTKALAPGPDALESTRPRSSGRFWCFSCFGGGSAAR